jgi:hypothetical protein
MRALFVVGMMIAASAAAAQSKRVLEVLDPLTSAYVGASVCGFDVDASRFIEAVRRFGFDIRAEEANQELLDSIARSAGAWVIESGSATLSAENKDRFEGHCSQILKSIGPGGDVFPGIAAKKK